MGNKRLKAAVFAILAVLGAIGIAAWIWQLMSGLAVTGMNNATSWGTYIICFMFFVGLSAGGLIVASSATVFGIERYHQVSVPAILLSLVCICVAASFVLIDMGGVQRVFNLLLHPNFTSPLMWDVTVISTYLVIDVVYLVLMTRRKRNEKALAACSWVALPVAILVHSVTAWIFGLQVAKAWHSAIMAPLFVASALDSGLAALIMVLAGLRRLKMFEFDKGLERSLAGLLCVCVAVDAFMIFSECLTMGYPAGAEAETLSIMMTGVTAPFFWTEVVVGLAIPFFVLVIPRARRCTPVVVASCACVVLGVFCKRCWLLLTSFVNLNVAGAGGVTYGRAAMADYYSMWALGGTYAPTFVEVAIVVGVICLAALAFLVAAPRVFAAAEESERSVKAERRAGDEGLPAEA